MSDKIFPKMSGDGLLQSSDKTNQKTKDDTYSWYITTIFMSNNLGPIVSLHAFELLWSAQTFLF